MNQRPMYSAALCRGLIEAMRSCRATSRSSCAYSAALCRGLIEALGGYGVDLGGRAGIPRLYAAASLKHVHQVIARECLRGYSAALCRGLIEAP